jgi:hypothetical protein
MSPVFLIGSQQIPQDAHLIELTVHCPWHPKAVLFGWATYDGVHRLVLGRGDAHEYLGGYQPTDDERRRLAALNIPVDLPVAKPKADQNDHWHFSPRCVEVDLIRGRPRRCSYEVRLASRHSQMTEFLKGLWMRRAASLMFYNIGPFLEDLGRQGADGLLTIFDQLGVDQFVAVVNRKWNPESADKPVCRVGP